ncbi:MAG: lytic transglycosylase domain-containing protein [Kiritimatiellaeota bacterium]|nr:lytic transglycosylase domain-containing protein [Kiritimatiellota bacterium]
MYTKLVRRRASARWLLPSAFLVFSAVLSLTLSYRHPLSFFTRSRPSYDSMIEDAAERHCVDPALIKAVIWRESRFDPNARGAKGEVGLMQIRPRNGAVEDWAVAYGLESPKVGLLFNPELNLEIGTWYLARALRKWRGYKHSVELALSEYNAGAMGMTAWIPEDPDGEVADRITITSTRRYVRSIMDRYERCLEARVEKKRKCYE